ncbi:MAG: NADH:ubiquinone reductase (Na(+)-transporting) subunit B [Bacteroidales bacterium]|nr:NADH:ubiquinone reductase (Na(+)-transporting) subunit B [Bacteroidales bacterium]
MFNNLRRFIDKIKPNFTEGGKFPWLKSTFEAFETFAFTPNRVTKRGCHVRDAVDLKRAMIVVVIALAPAMLFGMWNIGYQTSLHASDWPYELGTAASWWYCLWFGFLRMLPMLAVSYIVGLGIEFTFAQIRHHEVNEGFLVTGFLIPMIVPVTTPLWQLALATAFAVIIGKEVFGGTGMNFLNPALVARAFLFFAYPTRMSGDSVWIAADLWGTDAISSATPLAELAAGIRPSASALDLLIGTIPGSTCETSVIAILLGVIILLLTGIASWRIMLSVILGGGLMGLFFNLLSTLNLPQLSTLNSQLSTYLQLPFYYHYLMGGFMFGAVFMATDPVTAAQTNVGKWIYGLLIGIFAVMLRVLNPAYPEGMMLSILLMNCFAPLIDHCVVARNIKKRQKRALVQQKSTKP